jgi:hypothetical protein
MVFCLAAAGLLGSGVRALADEPEVAPAPQPCNREHVYVFMVNGLTVLPHIYGSMNPVGRTLSEHGYCHNETATHYYRWSFQNKIRCIHQSDPQARIVLVGYSIGSGVIHSMARTFEKEGIPIALMVYLDGHSIVNHFDEKFCNVERVVNINSSSHILKGCAVPHADYTVQIESSRHLSVPKKEATLEVLLRELDMVAATVPPPPVEMNIQPQPIPPAEAAPVEKK